MAKKKNTTTEKLDLSSELDTQFTVCKEFEVDDYDYDVVQKKCDKFETDLAFLLGSDNIGTSGSLGSQERGGTTKDEKHVFTKTSRRPAVAKYFRKATAMEIIGNDLDLDFILDEQKEDDKVKTTAKGPKHHKKSKSPSITSNDRSNSKSDSSKWSSTTRSVVMNELFSSSEDLNQTNISSVRGNSSGDSSDAKSKLKKSSSRNKEDAILEKQDGKGATELKENKVVERKDRKFDLNKKKQQDHTNDIHEKEISGSEGKADESVATPLSNAKKRRERRTRAQERKLITQDNARIYESYQSPDFITESFDGSNIGMVDEDPGENSAQSGKDSNKDTSNNKHDPNNTRKAAKDRSGGMIVGKAQEENAEFETTHEKPQRSRKKKSQQREKAKEIKQRKPNTENDQNDSSKQNPNNTRESDERFVNFVVNRSKMKQSYKDVSPPTWKTNRSASKESNHNTEKMLPSFNDDEKEHCKIATCNEPSQRDFSHATHLPAFFQAVPPKCNMKKAKKLYHEILTIDLIDPRIQSIVNSVSPDTKRLFELALLNSASFQNFDNRRILIRLAIMSAVHGSKTAHNFSKEYQAMNTLEKCQGLMNPDGIGFDYLFLEYIGLVFLWTANLQRTMGLDIYLKEYETDYSKRSLFSNLGGWCLWGSLKQSKVPIARWKKISTMRSQFTLEEEKFILFMRLMNIDFILSR